MRAVRKAHAHSAYFSPDDAHVYACDLGSDHVWIFKFDAATGTLVADDPPGAKVPPGAGPRHLVFSRDGEFVYVADEMGNSVTAFARNSATGALSWLETVQLSAAGDQPGKATAAEIVLHPLGKWLYLSNRGPNTISVLEIGSTGRLKLVQRMAAGVKSPRSFAVDPTGRWMVTAGQDDNQIAVLALSPLTGRLSATTQLANVPSPVCVLFDSYGHRRRE